MKCRAVSSGWSTNSENGRRSATLAGSPVGRDNRRLHHSGVRTSPRTSYLGSDPTRCLNQAHSPSSVTRPDASRQGIASHLPVAPLCGPNIKMADDPGVDRTQAHLLGVIRKMEAGRAVPRAKLLSGSGGAGTARIALEHLLTRTISVYSILQRTYSARLEFASQ
jgi:hypothetical protein